MPGDSIKVTVTSASPDGALPYDFQALLETELLKDDPDLREDNSPNTIITCRITEYSQPGPIITTGPSLALTKSSPKTQQYERITGTMNVAFQAKTATGGALISDNVSANYDEQFDGSGVSTSHGVMGSLSGTWGKLKGGQNSEAAAPPTPAELRSRLILDAVQQIAEHLVNTNESLDVYLAKQVARSTRATRMRRRDSGNARWRPSRLLSPIPKPMRTLTGSTILASPMRRWHTSPKIKRRR